MRGILREDSGTEGHSALRHGEEETYPRVSFCLPGLSFPVHPAVAAEGIGQDHLQSPSGPTILGVGTQLPCSLPLPLPGQPHRQEEQGPGWQAEPEVRQPHLSPRQPCPSYAGPVMAPGSPSPCTRCLWESLRSRALMQVGNLIQ